MGAKPPPSAVYVRVPLSPELVARAAEHAERIEELARMLPDAARLAKVLFRASKDLLTAVEKDMNAAAAHVSRRRKRKLPKRRRDR